MEISVTVKGVGVAVDQPEAPPWTHGPQVTQGRVIRRPGDRATTALAVTHGLPGRQRDRTRRGIEHPPDRSSPWRRRGGDLPDPASGPADGRGPGEQRQSRDE